PRPPRLLDEEDHLGPPRRPIRRAAHAHAATFAGLSPPPHELALLPGQARAARDAHDLEPAPAGDARDEPARFHLRELFPGQRNRLRAGRDDSTLVLERA